MLITPALICDIYRTACHGAGAAPRWEARDRLEEVAQASGRTVPELLNAHGLDLGAYFASKPISR